MQHRLRILPPLAAALLAGCGAVNDANEALGGLSTQLELAKQCMPLQTAMLTASLNPPSVAQDAQAGEQLLYDMRELQPNLPSDGNGRDSPRVAYGRIVEQIQSIRGKGPEAAKALMESPRYKSDVDLLARRFEARCKPDKDASASAG